MTIIWFCFKIVYERKMSMALKTKLDTQDSDTSFIDIPLFATVEDAIKDIQLDESYVKIQMKEENKEND